MKYTQFCNEKISKLGFGTMRLPLVEGESQIDINKTEKMIDIAIKGGVNYFDTALLNHGGIAQKLICDILKKYPRDNYYIANKYPGFMLSNSYDARAFLENQLKECNEEYFDFYLLQNVWENSINTYESQEFHIIDDLIQAKKEGLIKHLGFSCPGSPEILEKFLLNHKEEMEFCQIPLNYYDWTYNSAKEKYEILRKYNIPIIASSPLCSGKLTRLDDYYEKLLKKLRPWETSASWAIYWVDKLEGISIALPDMTRVADINDNLHVYNFNQSLQSSEWNFMVDLGVKVRELEVAAEKRKKAKTRK